MKSTRQSSIQCGPKLVCQGVALPYQNLTSFEAKWNNSASAFTLRRVALALMLLPSYERSTIYAITQIVAQMLSYNDGVNGAGKIFPNARLCT